jgi:tripartite-type tricarboxylate transporter receptor subunit TctC
MKIKTYLSALVIAGGAAAGCALATNAAAQEDPAKFFAGKTIDFIIGSSPGGGYATYAMALSHHLGKHLPGNPSVVGRNLPGAGSLVAANLLYNKAPKDGLTFGALFMGAVMEPLLGDKAQAQFDPRKFNFVGSANRETSICVAWHDSPIKTFQDMFEKEMIVGSSGVTSSIGQYPMVLNNVLDTKFKVVSGYPGSHQAALAVEKGEMQGICGMQWTSFITNFQHWLDNKKVRIIAQISAPEGDPTLNKMGVPKVWDYVKNEEDRKTLEVIFSQLDFGRPYVLPPGVPAERVEAYRKAFEATMKDPEFLAEAAKLKLNIDPLSGAEVQKLVEQVYATPPALVERARAALK